MQKYVHYPHQLQRHLDHSSTAVVVVVAFAFAILLFCYCYCPVLVSKVVYVRRSGAEVMLSLWEHSCAIALQGPKSREARDLMARKGQEGKV